MLSNTVLTLIAIVVIVVVIVVYMHMRSTTISTVVVDLTNANPALIVYDNMKQVYTLNSTGSGLFEYNSDTMFTYLSSFSETVTVDGIQDPVTFYYLIGLGPVSTVSHTPAYPIPGGSPYGYGIVCLNPLVYNNGVPSVNTTFTPAMAAAIGTDPNINTAAVQTTAEMGSVSAGTSTHCIGPTNISVKAGTLTITW